MKVATIHDVAQKAGVSITTVSRVINNRKEVNAETRLLVLNTMQSLDYTPNTSARNLNLKHNITIAVVVSGRRNIFLTDVAEGIINHGKKTGYDFLLEFIEEKEDEFEAVRKLYTGRKLNGVIFLGSGLDGHVEDIDRLNLPIVFSTISVAQIENKKISSISVDNYNLGYKSIEKLIAYGHKKIALAGYLASEESMDSTGKRLLGAIDCLKNHELSFDKNMLIHTNFNIENSYNATLKLLNKTKDFTAVFAMSDIMAMGVIRAMHDSHINVPKDVSVIGFDGIQQAQYFIPSIASWQQPADDIAQKTIFLMQNALNKKYSNIIVPAKWIEGESIRKV